MFLGYQGEKIKFYTDKQLDPVMYNLTKTEETDKEYIIDGDEYVLKTDAIVKRQYAEARSAEILKELDELDLKSIRAIRDNDEEYIAQYAAQAEALREELRELKK